MSEYHQPVMPVESEKYLVANPSGRYADCTLGGGGHSLKLLEKYPELKVIGIDCDEAAISEAEKALAPYKDRVAIYRENFRSLKELFERENIPPVDGILADLGVSSRQLDDASRGFRFDSGVLDMRMDSRLPGGAEELINTLDEKSLADVFYNFGEEWFSRPIARKIVEERRKTRITSGHMLAAVVEKAKRRTGRIHPATKVFQALRIAVNRELESLSLFLEQLPGLLVSGGRAVVISYHSLEDRQVKHSFRELSQQGVYHLLTKKVVMPSKEEVRENPRSRSAKLRAAEKI